MRTSLRFVPCILFAIALACSGSLPHPPYMAQPSSALTPVPLPPPPARVELVPASPAKGAVWIDGEWVFRRGRWAWTLGQWVVPAPGTFFSPWTMVRTSDGSLLHAPGVWRDAKGQPVASPPPIAVATAQAGPVVDAEGVTETTGRTMKPGETSAQVEQSAPTDGGPPSPEASSEAAPPPPSGP